MANPKILNLDDIELPETDVTIKHNGVDHKMRVLTVDMFIAQQKRAAEHEKAVQAGTVDVAGEGITEIVGLIRDAIVEFFPTLPVGEIETSKLFRIFAWLNELTAEMNEQSAPDEALEGNDPVKTEKTES